MTDYHLVIDGTTAEESWTYLDDDAALSDAPFIISLTRLKEEADALAERSAPLGVIYVPTGWAKLISEKMCANWRPLSIDWP